MDELDTKQKSKVITEEKYLKKMVEINSKKSAYKAEYEKKLKQKQRRKTMASNSSNSVLFSLGAGGDGRTTNAV